MAIFFTLYFTTSILIGTVYYTYKFVSKSRRKSVILSTSLALSVVSAVLLGFSFATQPPTLISYVYDNGEVVHMEKGEVVTDINLDDYASIPLVKVSNE